MGIHSGLRTTSVIFCFSLFSFSLKAQDGNHCGVRKSAYRLSLDSGKRVYVLLCMSCHQPDGIGVPKIGPSLNTKTVVGDKKKIIELVIRGSSVSKEMNDAAYNKIMPPNPKISDQEIADVLTYIRNSFGNKASVVKVSDVKLVRDKLN